MHSYPVPALVPKCRTILPPRPGIIANFEEFCEDHFQAPSGRLLPIDTPWTWTGQELKQRGMKCEACGSHPRGNILYLLTHWRTVGVLHCCKLCSLKLQHSSPEIIATEKGADDIHKVYQGIIATYHATQMLWDREACSLSGWPDPQTEVTFIGFGEQWRWRVKCEMSNFSDVADSLEGALEEAGWEYVSMVRCRELAREERETEARNLAFEVHQLEGLEEMFGDHLIVW